MLHSLTSDKLRAQIALQATWGLLSKVGVMQLEDAYDVMADLKEACLIQKPGATVAVVAHSG